MGQKPTELTPYQSPAHYFGAELRHWRTRRGLSHAALGKALNYHPTFIGMIERAERTPDRLIAEALDRVLETGETFTRLWPLLHADRMQTSTSRHVQEPDVSGSQLYGGIDPELLTTEGLALLMALDRRGFLRGGAALLTAGPSMSLAAPTSASTRSRRSVSPEAVGNFARQLSEHHSTDNMLGPQRLMTTIHEQTLLIDQLRRDATGDTRSGLLQVGSRYLEFLGWLHQDAGDAAAALAWCDRAVEWAQEAQDDAMVSFVLMRKANQAVGQGDLGRAIGLAQAAQRRQNVPVSTVHVLALQQEAQAHAGVGDPVACLGKLDEAEALISKMEYVESDPARGRYCDMSLYLAIKRAACHLELGQARESINGYRQVLAELPAEYHRDRGQYLTQLAEAYAQAGEPDQACAYAEEALVIAAETGSQRTITDLRGLRTTLLQWATVPAVSILDEHLAAFS